MEALKTIWDFFQNEVLGMNWLNRLIETILNACGLDTTGKIGASIQFFIYDTDLDCQPSFAFRRRFAACHGVGPGHFERHPGFD